MSQRKLHQELISRLWVKGQRRYVLVTVAFVVWMLFFDQYRFSTKIGLSQAIDKLEETKVYYEEEIVKANLQKADLEKNKEKYAREKYLMHRENEDVFLLKNK